MDAGYQKEIERLEQERDAARSRIELLGNRILELREELDKARRYYEYCQQVAQNLHDDLVDTHQERNEARRIARRLLKRVKQLEAQIETAKQYEPFKTWSEDDANVDPFDEHFQHAMELKKELP